MTKTITAANRVAEIRARREKVAVLNRKLNEVQKTSNKSVDIDMDLVDALDGPREDFSKREDKHKSVKDESMLVEIA